MTEQAHTLQQIFNLTPAFIPHYCYYMPISKVARSKAWDRVRLLAGIVRSNPAGGMDVCLFKELRVVQAERFLRRADHLPRGALPKVVCLSVIVKPRQRRVPAPPGALAPWGKRMSDNECLITTECCYVVDIRGYK